MNWFTKLCLVFQELAVYEKEPESIVKLTEEGKLPLFNDYYHDVP